MTAVKNNDKIEGKLGKKEAYIYIQKLKGKKKRKGKLTSRRLIEKVTGMQERFFLVRKLLSATVKVIL